MDAEREAAEYGADGDAPKEDGAIPNGEDGTTPSGEGGADECEADGDECEADGDAPSGAECGLGKPAAGTLRG